MPRTHRIEAGFLRAKQEGMEQAKMQDNARWELQSIQNARMQNKTKRFQHNLIRRGERMRAGEKKGKFCAAQPYTGQDGDGAPEGGCRGGYANDEGYTHSDFRTELTKSLGIGQNPRDGGEAVHAPERAFAQPEIKVGQNP